MGRELKPLELRDASGKLLGRILVAPFPVAGSMERAYDLFRIISGAGGEAIATGLNAGFAGWFAMQGGLLHDPRLVDSAAMSRAVESLGRAFKDGKEFVAWCRSWLCAQTSEGLVSKVRFEPAGKNAFIELGDQQTWDMAGLPGTPYEAIDQGVLLSGVFNSIAVNTRPFWHTWGAPEMVKGAETIKALFREVKGLLEFADTLRELLMRLRSAAESTSGPIESPEGTPTSTAK